MCRTRGRYLCCVVCPGQVNIPSADAGHTSHPLTWWEGWDSQHQTLCDTENNITHPNKSAKVVQ